MPNKRTKPYSKNGPRANKNVKFIQRSKQMVEMHQKQKQIEDSYAHSTVDPEQQLLAQLAPVRKHDDDYYNQLITRYSSKVDKHFEEKNHNEVKQIAKQSKFEIKPVYQPIANDRGNQSSDFYKNLCNHFDFELSADQVENLLAVKYKTIDKCWHSMGKLKIELPTYEKSAIELQNGNHYYQPETIKAPSDFQILCIKSPLYANVGCYPLTALQSEIFNLLNGYQDVYFPQRALDNAEDLRFVYCLHGLNHILKSRSIILRNNEKLSAIAKENNVPVSDLAIPDNFRDQGLMRLKMLIMVPFREAALKVVDTLCQLLYGNQTEQAKKNGTISNYKRFVEEYSGQTLYFPKTNPKPVDYEHTFSGNTDDNFKIGMRFTKKSLSLFCDLDSSDILIASPLALRMLTGGSGSSKEANYDFLNSIEFLVIDQAELFLAQNWENLLFVLEHCHLKPQTFPNTNCQRVRNWCLSGLARFYRQTILLSAHELPEFRAVFNSMCCNYRGRIRVVNRVENAAIRNIVVPIQQFFRRLTTTTYSMESIFDDRFQYFIKEVLPQFTRSSFSHCMVYVPSYFDFVRLRNHFKAESVSFVQICEYSKDEKISRARDIFFHSGVHFMLYSERAHFFRRTRIKGIRHIIFYQPPNFPNFYSEMINLMLESNQNARDGLQDNMTATVIFSKYDILSLGNILGSDTSKRLIKSNKTSYVFSAE